MSDVLRSFNFAPTAWVKHGNAVVSYLATPLEAGFIEAVKAGSTAEGCIGKLPESCISYLSMKFPVTTNGSLPFYQSKASLSFDEERSKPRLMSVIILVPDDAALASQSSFADSVSYRMVEFQMFFPKGAVEKISIRGAYPVLSDNPSDFEGSGFAEFMQSIFPECATQVSDQFYRSFWGTFVKPAIFSEGSGEWSSTGSGMARTFLKYAKGSFCGYQMVASQSTTTGIGDRGRWSAGGNQLTIERSSDK